MSSRARTKSNVSRWFHGDAVSCTITGIVFFVAWFGRLFDSMVGAAGLACTMSDTSGTCAHTKGRKGCRGR
jgi:hypothetical protein